MKASRNEITCKTSGLFAEVLKSDVPAGHFLTHTTPNQTYMHKISVEPEGGTPPTHTPCVRGPGSEQARLRELTEPEGADEEQQGQDEGQQQVPRQQLVSEENHGSSAVPTPRASCSSGHRARTRLCI